MDPITDVREISRIAYGFMASKALFAALNLGVFEALSKEPHDLEALANETGLQEHRLLTLLTALVSLGVLAKEDAFYSNSPAAGRYLVRGKPAYFGDYYRYQIDRLIYPGMDNLEQALAGEPLHGLYNHAFKDAREAEDFTRGQHSGSKGPAFLLARSVDLSNCRNLLDVGGGSGAFSLAFCRENPELSATILDFPNVVCHAETFAREEGLSGRITPLPGNALETPWPENQDVVLMSYLLSAVPRTAVAALLRRALDALSPGGRLLLHDFTVAEDGTGPQLAALWYLPMMLGNPLSQALTAEELCEACEAEGFELLGVEASIPEITHLVTARKPA